MEVKKINVIIFLLKLLAFSVSLSLALYLFLSGYKKTSNLFYFFIISSSLFGASFYLIKCLFEDYIIPKILNEKMDVKIEYFQLDSDVETYFLNDKIVCRFTMNSIGKKLSLTIDLPKKIINSKDFILGTVRIKQNCNYKVSFLVKQYQYQNETFDYKLEPIGIDHESLENCLIKYSLKQSHKFKPKISYLCT